MKAFRLILVVAAAALITFGLGGTAQAFHSGGVAECVGCHSMHDPAGGALLVGSDESSTCLTCHNSDSFSSYHISTDESVLSPGVPPGNMTPGGDFAWLKKDYSWNPGWAPQNEDGDRHGHNIVAFDFSYDADATNTTAPGGDMDAAELACSSCHDQHGRLRRLSDGTTVTTGAPIIASGSYNTSPVPAAGQAVGVYRLLRGAGSEAGTGDVDFTSPVPAAVAPSSYNRSEATEDTRVAYGAGMSNFCATCHPDMHDDSGLLVHVVDQNLGTTIADNYNDYVGSGDLGGDIAISYDSLVPFQTNNSTDYVALASQANSDGSVTTGPASTDRVNCLSCHRAHASGWEHMTRWDNDIELIVVDGEWPGTDAASAEAAEPKWAKGRTVAERSKAYNDTDATDYATHQRVLCNKCHAKD
jgi:predicted CXXCH cytochrome family protein